MVTIAKRVLLSLLTAAAAVHAAVGAAPLAAQGVEGTLLEEGSGRPVEGAFLVLLDSDGGERAAGLTDAAGRFSVKVSEPGEYSLRVERIGYRNASTPLFRLRSGETLRQDLTAPVDAVILSAITVPMEESRCEASPEESARLAEVWEEARKALSVISWTERQERYGLRVRQYERELDGRTLRVREERSQEGTALQRGSPFVSRPPTELVDGGYVELKSDTVRYFGPDAEVLLSDVFLDHYCFRLEDREEGMIGLAFRPEERDSEVDIDGVLWLDRASAELRYLEYRYLGLPWHAEDAAGRVEFERLPNGVWIVGRWWIRAPAIERSPGRAYELGPGGVRSYPGGPPRDRVRAVFESGGRVEEIRTAEGELLRSAETAGVTGTVVDSTTGGPLAGAVVRLSGTGFRTVTDARGRYRMGGLPAGDYALTVKHARLDSLGLPPFERAVSLRTGATSIADLAVPYWTRILAAVGSRVTVLRRSAGDGAALVGIVTNAETGEPLAGAQVALGGAGVGTSTDEEGRFRFAVPPGHHTLEVVHLGYGTLRRPLAVEAGEEVEVTARLSPAPVPAEPLAAEVPSPDVLASRRSGAASYRITAEEIERYPAMGVVEMIALLVPGAEIGLDPATGCKVPLFRSAAGAGGGGVVQSLEGGAAPTRMARMLSGPDVPLVVVEGTPMANACELTSINPEDIARLDIMPGLFGVSRYGEKAAGGVIQVAIKDQLDQPDLEPVRRPGEEAQEPDTSVEKVQ